MQSRKQQGLSLTSVLLVIAVVLVGAVWWMHDQAAKRQQQGAEQQMLAEQQRQSEEKTHQLEAQRKAFEAQAAAERNKQGFDKAIAALAAIYAKWNDAVSSNSTPRIALSGPVASLQSLKRDAELPLVPECLVEPKKKMIAGMEKVIDGFIGFMDDRDIGKIIASLRFGEGGTLLAQYEKDSNACAPE